MIGQLFMPNPLILQDGKKERLLNKYFILTFLSNMFICLGMVMINSTIARYILAVFGNAAFSGYLNAAFAVLAIIARLVSGDLTDRRGRMKIILLGAGIFAISVFCFGVFPIVAALIIFRALQGFGYSTASTASFAAGADVLPEKRIGEGISMLGLGFALSTAVGAAIALSLVNGDDYSMVFFAATGVSVLSFVFALFLNYEKLPFYKNKIETQKKASAAIDLSAYKGLERYIEYKAVPATLVQIFNSMAFAMINFFIVIYADSIGITGTATFFTTMAVGMIITRTFSGQLYDKFGELPIGGVALIAQIVGLMLLIYTSDNYTFYAVGFIYGMSFGTVSTALHASAIKYSPVNRRGAASGTYQMSNDIAQGAGAVLWGISIDKLGFTSSFFGCIICTVVSMGLLLFFFNRRKLAGITGH